MAEDADDTGRKVRGTPFKPGPEWTGNAFGRPKGSKVKLSEDFLRDLLDAWGKYGVEALRAAATEKQSDFCKMVASLMPKEIAVKNELSEFTDEQLAALAALTEAILRDGPGAESEDSEGIGSKARH